MRYRENSRPSLYCLCVQNFTSIKTWYNITKAIGGHGDEAKVECIKEIDVFITTKEEGTNA